jgi:hypothetical protein
MSASKDANLSVLTQNYFICPECGKTHAWDGKNAFFADDRPPLRAN